MYSAVVGENIPEISVRSSLCIMLFKSSISLLILYQVIYPLSIIKNKILKSPTIVAELSISPFSSVSFCFMYCEAPLFSTHMFIVGYFPGGLTLSSL